MNLYLRLIFAWLAARRKPAIKLGETIDVTLRVLPNDIDVNGHMNNGRYLTIADLALIEYFVRCGLFRIALRNGWRPMLGGSIISYRRGLKPFKAYTLRFSMQCWDDRWSYMKFDFIQDEKVMATGYSKGAVVGKNGIVPCEQTCSALGHKTGSPIFPPAINAWIEADRLLLV